MGDSPPGTYCTVDNKPCVFPFKHNGIKYRGCTDAAISTGPAFCATEVDNKLKLTKATNCTVCLVTRLAGETAGAKIIRILTMYDQVSLKKHPEELAELISRGVDDGERTKGFLTNCGTTVLGIWAKAGVVHDKLKTKYIAGKAIEWVLKIADDKKALIKFDASNPPRPGSLMHYRSNSTNDHVEFLIGDWPADPKTKSKTGGGGDGGKGDLISIKDSVVWSNQGRPLVDWVDPDQLGVA